MSTRPTQAQAESFVGWMLAELIAEARGDRFGTLSVAPRGRLWLGRVAPEAVVQQSRLGERAERLDPCEIGLRVRPSALDSRNILCTARFVVWAEGGPDANGDPVWTKSGPIEVAAGLTAPSTFDSISTAGRHDLERALAAAGARGLSAEFHAELEQGKDGPELVVTLVNTSPEELAGFDTNLYETSLEVEVGATEPFTLDNLADSFRYDRQVPAYGVNGGVEQLGPGRFVTTDYGLSDRPRPSYWDEEFSGPVPDLTFATLASNPLPSLRALVRAMTNWGEQFWSEKTLRSEAARAGWHPDMLTRALEEADKFADELTRMKAGLAILEKNRQLRLAFMLANRAFERAPAVSHTTWRPFQIGFFLANVVALDDDLRDVESRIVDTLWFATGGGKTETYLLFVLTAAFLDRLRGKREGITSWGRFPLRMLSLQQTQRFADVLAAAELVRRDENIAGATFALGFLVGDNGTPNRILRDPGVGRPDPDDPAMPARYKVLIRCPFCGAQQLEMRFDKTRWALDHLCRAEGCPWGAKALPFRIVDEEIYRSLPTIVLGTLDKAASISMQAAMRGFYGAPAGRCSKPNHGFCYAPRSKSPTGCLFPGCSEPMVPLTQAAELYPPTIRMQDELHLLRDSLGAVDAHYEALLDGLQAQSGTPAKIIASSATLAGHDEQVKVLYRRMGRTFPLPGPRSGHSFWSRETDQLARRFVGLAPRGVTIEYATDQLAESLQRTVRRAVDDPTTVAAEVGVDPSALPGLVSAYGVDVVYGSTLKDVEAAARSFESQLRLDRLGTATLTGRTPLEEIHQTLERLTRPEPDFYDRIHLVAASSMLSHGVDIDRLNVMVMLGLPLSTAEFIQTTSRVGRTHPGLVLVLHKVGRERDAAVFRTFPSFVRHADRLIDPVPITARSRRVLELTFPGLLQGLIYGAHEPAALAAGLKQLTVPAAVRRAFSALPVLEQTELANLVGLLGFTGPLDENLRLDLSLDPPSDRGGRASLRG